MNVIGVGLDWFGIMISSQTAAGLIAGMIQGRIHIGEAWDSLDSQDALILVDGWAYAISRGGEEGLGKILQDIGDVKKLSDAWERFDDHLKTTIIEVMKTVIENVSE